MKNRFISFTIKIIVTIIAAFAIHLLVLKFLELPLLENKIVLSYILNATLAIAIFGLLFKYRKKVKSVFSYIYRIQCTFFSPKSPSTRVGTTYIMKELSFNKI